MDLSNQIQNAPAYNIPKALDPLRAWKVEVLRVDSVSGWDLVAGRLVIAFFFFEVLRSRSYLPVRGKRMGPASI